MIERQGYTYTPICDGCGEELPEEYGLRDAVEAIKDAGWTMEPPGEMSHYWSHYCPTCAAAFAFGEV